jgi:pyruvate carboxylase subunit B
MMGLPPGVDGAHTPEFYVDVLRKILDAGIPYHSVCFKDASGTASPSTVYETITTARKMLGEETHITFHSHESAGISVAQYVSAINAGADQVDCSLKPVSGGTSQPDILTLWNALRGTEFDLGIDVEKVREVERIFTECMQDYFYPPEALAVEPAIAFSPMPGGALTANTQMMRDNDIIDRYPEVILAMREVVAKGGFGTSVTPVSQFYFQQAFNNVMFGPWERIAEGYGKMVLGYFGRTPRPPDPEVISRAAEALKLDPTDRAPVDINDEDPAKGIGAARAALAEEGLEETEENIFIAATCREKGIQYLKGEAKVNVRKNGRGAKDRPEETGTGSAPGAAGSERAPASGGTNTYRVVIDGIPHVVCLDGETATVDGNEYAIEVTPQAADATSAGAPPSGTSAATATTGAGTRRVTAPLAGIVLRFATKVGSTVAKGDVILVLESMKMETEVYAPAAGVIAQFPVNQGEQVKNGDVLAVVRET